jgi:hypothetical protein
MFTDPWLVTSVEGTIAVSLFALTNVVTSAVVAAPPPLGVHCTTEFAWKFVPLTVIMNCGEPAEVDCGEVDEIVGTETGAVIVKTIGPDVCCAITEEAKSTASMASMANLNTLFMESPSARDSIT